MLQPYIPDISPDAVPYRPYLPPSRPWVMGQVWTELLFAHWSIDVRELRRVVPAALSLDTFEGRAWVGVVPFCLETLAARRLRLPNPLSGFPELNLRTYVTLDGEPGIYFFSLDAGNPLAVTGARLSYHLPYYRARMRIEHRAGAVRFASVRTHTGAPQARFRAVYKPVARASPPPLGSLEYFLTARYCLYSLDSRGNVYRGEIHHSPWPLAPARGDVYAESLAAAHGITLPADPPLLHYCQRMEMVGWLPERIRPAASRGPSEVRR